MGISHIQNTVFSSFLNPCDWSERLTQPYYHAAPTDNCKEYQTPFPAGISHAPFDIFCDTDFLGGDFMSVYAARLNVCMGACSNYNYWTTLNHNYWTTLNHFNSGTNCSAVTWDYFATTESANCYLKGGRL